MIRARVLDGAIDIVAKGEDEVDDNKGADDLQEQRRPGRGEQLEIKVGEETIVKRGRL
jgi:hypothetical protein